MGNRLSFGIGLYLRSFLSLALVGLPISIPGNLILEAMLLKQADPVAQLRIGAIYAIIVGCLQSAIVVATLHQQVQALPVKIHDIWSIGSKCWFTIVATTIVANIIITFGLVAIILPGLFFASRFALIDMAIVVDGYGGQAARQRSWDLTRNCWLSLFFAGGTCYVVLLSLRLMQTVVLEQLGIPDSLLFATTVFSECVLDLLQPLQTSILFSFYWHATADERTGHENAVVPPDETDTYFAKLSQAEQQEDADEPNSG